MINHDSKRNLPRGVMILSESLVRSMLEGQVSAICQIFEETQRLNYWWGHEGVNGHTLIHRSEINTVCWRGTYVICTLYFV
jgi:hypothetical protein